MAFEFVRCHVVRNCPDYIAQIDEYRSGEDTFLLAHLGVKRWAPSVLKELDRDWQTFRKIVPAPLFATAERDDKKFHRFVARYGFRPLQEVPSLSGEPRTLFYCPPTEITHGPVISINPINDTN